MSITELLVRGALIAALPLALTAALRTRAPALRHRVLTIGLATMAMLPLQVLGGPRWRPHVGTVRHAPRAESVVQAMTGIADDRRGDDASGSANHSAASVEPVGMASFARGAVVTYALLVGAIALAMLRFMGGWRVRRLLARARVVPPGHPTARAMAEASRALGVHGPVTLLASDECTVPFTAGIVRSRIVVPTNFHAWDDARVRAILLHELAHVRRRDLLCRAVADIACIANWFNPLVWIAARRSVTEGELACDDVVIACGVEPDSYASALVGLARAFRGRGVLEPTLGVARSDLRRRVARLVRADRADAVSHGGAVVVTLTLLVLGGAIAAVEPQTAVAPFAGTFQSTMNISTGGPEISTNSAGLQARWVLDGRHTGMFITGDVNLSDVVSGRHRPARGSFLIAQEVAGGLEIYGWPNADPAPPWVRDALRIAARQLRGLEMHGAGGSAATPRPHAPDGLTRVPGATLVGTPAISTDPGSQVVQAGWVEGGRRFGVFLRGQWRTDHGRPTTDDPRGWLDAFSYDASSGVVTRITMQRVASGTFDMRMSSDGKPAAADAAALAWAARVVAHVNEVRIP